MQAGGLAVPSARASRGWGRGSRKSPSRRPGSGELVAPSAGGRVLGRGTDTTRLPEGAVEKKDPQSASRRRPREASGRVWPLARTHV